MVKIYHNPRCSKSRLGVKLLKEKNIDFQIIKYLDQIPTVDQLKNIINLLGISPIELVRKGEKIWKDNYKEKNLTDNDIIELMVNTPKLIERPIVVNGDKAVIARPTEKILEII